LVPQFVSLQLNEWLANKGKKDNKITVEPASFEASEPEKECAL
jgi:hypothetical protein